MIKVSIRKVAFERGVTTAYQLQKLMNIQPSLAARWYKDDLKMIGIKSLNNLCEMLECQPSDLLVYTSAKDLVRKPVRETIAAADSASDKDLLSTAEVASRLKLSERTIRDNYKSGNLPFRKIGTKNFVTQSDFQTFYDSRNNT
jgi:excisionase family DNA binding protein